ncbi:MAG: NAD(P)-binding domain-containing protein [Quadrisphaera sp.]
MVPAGKVTHSVIDQLKGLLSEGDVVIDGGNSKYTDDAAHAESLAERGIGFVDCGVSGGIWGLENGYGLMCGGDAALVERLLPVFDALRPEGPREEGFVHAGAVGAGHYAKMVHNGIEYGLMQAYAEGFELLTAKDIVTDVTGSFKAWDAWHRGALLAARPAGARPGGRGHQPRQHPRLRERLRRGPLDGGGGHQRVRADACDHRGALRALRLPPGRLPPP